MNEGQKILISSLGVFALIVAIFLAFTVFIYPRIQGEQETDVLSETEVLSVIDEDSPYSYQCPVNYPTIYVPEDYPSIQRAIDSVVDGATIIIAPGIYNESIVLKSNICLIGEEYGKVEIQGFSDTVIEVKGNNRIQNLKISSLGKSEVGVSVVDAEMVSILTNSFENFKTAVLVENSKMVLSTSVFRNIDLGVFVKNSLFFVGRSNIDDYMNSAVEVVDSEGEIIGMVIVGGEYGVKAINSDLFFNSNNFRDQTVASLELSEVGDYELGDNSFNNVNEEILYQK